MNKMKIFVIAMMLLGMVAIANARTNNRHKYEDIDDFEERLAPVELKDKYGYIDKSGKVVINPKYDYVWSFSDGLAVVCKNNKFGYIDKSGKEVIPIQYDEASMFSTSNSLAEVELNSETFHINKKSERVD